MDEARRSTLSDRDMSDDHVTDNALTDQSATDERAPLQSADQHQSSDPRTSASQASYGDLAPVADQLIAIAEQLRSGDRAAVFASLTGGEDRASTNADAWNEGAPAPISDAPQSAPATLSARRRSYAFMARKAYDVRRTRGTFFGDPDLFGEPAWDILLDLYVAHVDDKSVSVSSACIGSAAPPTTGLRWLGVLAEQGLILREQDAEDQRRILVRLSDTGLKAMDRYFEEAVKRGAT